MSVPRHGLLAGGILFLAAVTSASLATGAANPACTEVLHGATATSEELTYTVRWGMVTAGEAVMRLTPLFADKRMEGFRVETQARSNKTIDAFFKVRDKVVSVSTPDFSRSLSYSTTLREGKFTRDNIVEFDDRELTSMLFRNGKFVASLKLPEAYYDPLSGLYHFRLLEAGPGQTVFLDATDGLRILRVRIEVLSRETVRTPAGDFPSLKVELFPEALDGPFFRKKHGRIFMWFSDDACRLPVKMASEVFIGAIETMLSKIAYRPVTTTLPEIAP